MNLKAASALLIVFALASSISCKKEKLKWQHVQKLESHTNHRLNNILFVNDTLGYVAGGLRFSNATMLVTHNGGNTWKLHDVPEAGKGMYGITQKYSGEIYALGFDGKLIHTNDDGETWHFNQINWEPFKDLAFIEPHTGIMIGGVSFKYGVMAYINDQYQTYHFDTFAYELNDIEMLNNHVGYISGYGVILKTDDGAVSWKILDVKNDNFTAIHALNTEEVWACGISGSIYHTNDGGNSWERQRNGNNFTTSQYLQDIVFKDRTNGWAVGEKGQVIYTNDGGHTWKDYEKFTGETLRNIVVAPDGNLIVAGDNGTLYKLSAP